MTPGDRIVIEQALRALPARYLDDDGDGYGGVPFVSLDQALAALAAPSTPERGCECDGYGGHAASCPLSHGEAPSTPEPNERAWCICGKGVLPENWPNHLLSQRGEHRMRTPAAPSTPEPSGLREAVVRLRDGALRTGDTAWAEQLDIALRAAPSTEPALDVERLPGCICDPVNVATKGHRHKCRYARLAESQP